MNEPTIVPVPKRSRMRLAFWLALVVSWAIMLPLLWSAVSTLPSPERLEQTRTVPIPTLGSFLRVMAVSAVELAVTLVLIWPGWRRAYTLRLFGAAVLLGTWFVFTTPMALTRLEWVHRRWLALVAFVLLVAWTYSLLGRWWTRRGRSVQACGHDDNA